MSEIPQSILNRVLGLLAKAESTTFPAERDSLIEKAQAIMAREAIDHAMLDKAAGRKGSDPIAETIIIPAPYADSKVMLLHVIGKANGCTGVTDSRITTAKGSAAYVLIGMPDDVQAVTTLFGALALHAVGDMLQVTAPSGAQTVGARKRFMSGFVHRIGDRLTEARTAVRKEYEAETGTSVALVLRERDDLVDARYRDYIAGAQTRQVVRRSKADAAYHAGMSSANRAGLGQTSMPAGRRALGS